MKRLLFVFAISLLSALPGAAIARQVALVLGNGAYTGTAPLANAPNDASDLAARLRELDFEVFEGIDLDRAQMLELITAFAGSLAPSDMALFYFAGHGVQIGRQNYLIPVDATAGNEEELVAASVRLDAVLRTMELRAGTRVVILDACRNNPFLEGSTSRSGGRGARGLSRVEAGVGSYIAFSTQPGNVAADGTGRNSPFTAALLEHIGTPGADIHAVMRQVRSSVVSASGGGQIPWENSSLLDELYLIPTGAAPAQSAQSGNSGSKIVLPGETLRPAPSFLPRLKDTRETCLALSGGARLCASSILAPQSGNSYGPENLLDGNPATAWVEGLNGDGIGAYLAVEFNEPRSFGTLELVNGYAKTSSTFSRNGRVREFFVSASNGQRATLWLDDHAQWQAHGLGGFTDVLWIQFEIGSVYPGSKWPDTAISELRLQ